MFANTNWATKILAYGFLTILALLPVHAFLSTWAISNFGFEWLFKGWKELLLLAVLLPVSVYVVAKKPAILKTLWHRTINRCIFAYTGLSAVLALFAQNGQQAAAVGLVFNLRFFAIFCLAQVLLELLPTERLKSVALKIVFAGGLVVVAFGLLQVLALPADFLRHFGYSQAIIPPYFTIDNNEAYVRILSTLRGPNVLGAFLVFWLPILLHVSGKLWGSGRAWRSWVVLVWLASIITLYGSQSRSALIAVCITLGFFVVFSVPKKQRLHIALAVAVSLVSFGAVAIWQWNSAFVQSTILHRDPTEAIAVDSDDQRIGSLQSAWQDITSNPLGQGTGSAGLASTYGETGKITENYYLQIGQELGIIGLLLFVAIVVIAGVLLVRIATPWSIELSLLASLLGLSLIALVQPAWGDETVSMLWWGLAPLYMFGTARLKQKS